MQLLINGFNVGQELTSLIFIPESTGTAIPVENLAHLDELRMNQVQSNVTKTPCGYGGQQLHRNIYHGWEGHFAFTRHSGALSGLIHSIVDKFQTTGAESYFTIYATILNTAISLGGASVASEYIITKAVFGEHDPGAMNGTEAVTPALAFRCQKARFIDPSAIYSV